MQPKVGMLVLFNNAGTSQAAIVIRVINGGCVDLLVFTVNPTYTPSVPFSDSGIPSTCRPTDRL